MAAPDRKERAVLDRLSKLEDAVASLRDELKLLQKKAPPPAQPRVPRPAAPQASAASASAFPKPALET